LKQCRRRHFPWSFTGTPRIGAVRASASPIASIPAKSRSRPLLTVVVPVYNGGEEIVENVGVIQRAVAAGLLGEEIE